MSAAGQRYATPAVEQQSRVLTVRRVARRCGRRPRRALVAEHLIEYGKV
jgi:hypothetical protein